ncbi:MAG: hypothetical protein EBX41_09705 [Chitinophagia bacterium]|nr:hypothetical protein [Chitinophagia bacterium]
MVGTFIASHKSHKISPYSLYISFSIFHFHFRCKKFGTVFAMGVLGNKKATGKGGFLFQRG